MSKGYILYKQIKDDSDGTLAFHYVMAINGFNLVYTEKIRKAKRFSLLKALYTSIIFKLSFVPEKVVKIYR